MKVKKADLELLTESAMTMTLLAGTALILSGCKNPEIYGMLETTARHCDQVRVDLDLPKLAPEELTSGLFQKAAARFAALLDSDEGQEKIARVLANARRPVDQSKMN